MYRQQDYSVLEAKKAIQDFRKAVGRPEGMAGLTVFYCEEAFDLFDVYAVEDEGYYTALVRMFEQAMKRVIALPEHERTQFIKRLTQVRTAGQELGWGVGYAFDALWKQANLPA
jgi:predicted Ser/Thr protein kinase